MDIVVWLRCLGLGEYEAAFRERELLAPVYGWFTEGFDTRDITALVAIDLATV